MLNVVVPDDNQPERAYILKVLLGEFLGLEYSLRFDSLAPPLWQIELPSGDWLYVEDHFFSHYPAPLSYLTLEAVPKQVDFVSMLFHTEGDLPVIYGEARPVDPTKKPLICPIDLFASAFFMLTRWEEYVCQERDQYDRFAAHYALAFKFDFLDRPVVNEFVETLFAMLSHLDPSLKRKPRTFRMLPSHDVDDPFYELGLPFINAFSRYLKKLTGQDKSPIIERHSLLTWARINAGQIQYDPFNTFDYLLEQSFERQLSDAYYFIPAGNRESRNGNPVTQKVMLALMQRLLEAGHEVGIHGDFGTYQDAKIFNADTQLLRDAVRQFHPSYELIGGRQHYLQLALPKLWQIYHGAGLRYDTSLGFADRAGYRAGVCYEYPVFDFLERQLLPLRERPLIAMEGSVISECYMNCGYSDEALAIFIGLKKQCQRYKGDFTLLWHNSHLLTPEDKRFYCAILDA